MCKRQQRLIINYEYSNYVDVVYIHVDDTSCSNFIKVTVSFFKIYKVGKTSSPSVLSSRLHMT